MIILFIHEKMSEQLENREEVKILTFKKIETRDLPDIQSIGTLYEHEETGAKVLHLDNEDINKAFTISFKTPPYNDNGITHILEHSVLNGSKKYPSKEPFVELIKGSLNTFVNAMTFSDKTIYPVASTNQKDFKHLMGVYLDAVFQPLFIDNPQILAQEGWHYHLENEADDLIYKGVVYNEMKGATASPERQLFKEISAQLYPESIYAFESGGEPAAIPTLTQKEFIDYHQKYYHPSNSQTILYGDLDLDEAFANLEKYFNGKGKLKEKVSFDFEVSTPKTKHFEDTYSLTTGDDPTDKDFLAVAWHVADAEDYLDGFGLKILEEILLGSNQAPLKKALLDADIGGDISGGSSEIGFPTAFSITAKYADRSNREKFKTVIEDTLTEIVEEGIDTELIDAALNKIIFRTKEAAISEDNPRGVLYAITALSTWLYADDPFVNLEFSKYLDQLTEEAHSGYFEKLIQDKLLDNTLQVEITLKAEPGKNDKIEEELHKKLQKHKASLSDEEIQEMIAETQALMDRQNTPDKPEDLAKIPMLTRADLDAGVEEYPITRKDLFKDTDFFHAEQFTSGIDYIRLYFDVKDFDEKDYLLLSVFSNLLSNLDTKNYNAAKLQTEINKYTGGILGSISTFENKEGIVQPYFVLSGRALSDSLDHLIRLFKEISMNTLFTDTTEIQKIVQRLISNFEDAINFNAHVLAAYRALSQVRSSAKINELTDGIDQFNYLKNIHKQLKEGNSNQLTKDLEDLLNRLLNRNRINALYTGEAKQAEFVYEKIYEVFKDLPAESIDSVVNIEPGVKQAEAYITAQDVNYVAIGANIFNYLDYTGASNVLSTAIRFDYLWNEIRVKGGAYGSLYAHRRNGNLALSSYRDPNIKETLDVYQNLPEYIRNITLSDEELTKYIIGTISPLEQPKSASSKGLTALRRLKTEISADDIKTLKEEILSTQANDLPALAEDFAQITDKFTTVVIGNKAQIDKNEHLFDVIHKLY